MKVVTAAQMAALELDSQRRGVTTDTLMENAGLAVAETTRSLLGGIAGARVLILVGPGNNGADGLVTARHLQRWGANVAAYVVSGRPSIDPKMELARAYGVEVISSSDDPGMDSLGQLLGRSRVIIEAVLGTGRARPLEGVVKEAMLRLKACRAGRHRPLIIALDFPTGLNADSGEVGPGVSRGGCDGYPGTPQSWATGLSRRCLGGPARSGRYRAPFRLRGRRNRP